MDHLAPGQVAVGARVGQARVSLPAIHLDKDCAVTLHMLAYGHRKDLSHMARQASIHVSLQKIRVEY